MSTRTLTTVIHREEDLYVAECPEAGSVGKGSTVEEAVANLNEATGLYLEDLPQTNILASDLLAIGADCARR